MCVNGKVAEIRKKFENDIKNFLVNSENFKEWLNLQSRFYHYSFFNLLMLHMQKDTVGVEKLTMIGGEKNFWNKLGRTIKEGEKPFKIFAPYLPKYSSKPRLNPLDLKVDEEITVIGKITKKVYEKDNYGIYMLQLEEVNNEEKSGYINVVGEINDKVKLNKYYRINGLVGFYKSGRNIKVETIQEIEYESSYTKQSKRPKGFILVDVYDVSQTEGKELPSICKKIDGSSKEAETLNNAISKLIDIPVVKEELDCAGYFSPKELKIGIKNDLSLNHETKTLIHEYTHYLIFKKFESKNKSLIDYINKGSKSNISLYAVEEIIVESIAYVVCNYFGLDTTTYSFEYVGSWAKGDFAQISKVCNLIQSMSEEIITSVENVINEKKVA